MVLRLKSLIDAHELTLLRFRHTFFYVALLKLLTQDSN